MTDVDLEHLQNWIGREEQQSETLSHRLVSQFNATFNRKPDSAMEETTPLLIHWCLTQPIVSMSDIGRDGHPALGGFLPPVPLPRRMWAGGAIEFLGDIRVGDRVNRRSTVSDVQLKQGRSGALCFVTVTHEISVAGQIVTKERQDIVYRDTPKPDQTQIPPKPADVGAHVATISPHPTLLFRYSALTFNGHRIHYDRSFCTETEGYPGLVVHGPLQATALCQFAADLKGTRPGRFHFRSLSPLFDTADFTLNAKETDDGMKLWTAAGDGPVAMDATVVW